MRYFLEFLVIGLVFFLNTIQHSDAKCIARYSSSYTCYKPNRWKTTHYKACGWLWRNRCQRHVTYFNKYIKSTCYKYNACPSYYGWSGWGSWGSWGSCPYSSSTSYRKRYKYNTCSYSSSKCCNCGSRRKISTYSYQKCTHGSWSSWGSWKKTGSCSASCRKCGSSQYPRQKYYKYRTCTSPRPSNGGRYCSGSSYTYKYNNCNSHYCKVYGGWSKWYNGNWGSCSASCKKCGSNTNPTQSQRRFRYCNNPYPACGGSSCKGTSSYYSSKVCNTQYCKVNGGWSSWYFSGSWSSCSASCRTCGSSVIPLQSRTRRRSCNNPSPGCGGRSCSGSSSSTTSRYCNTAYCKVNGGWSGWKSWGSWDKCSAECKTCGSSSNPYKTRRRYRVCNNPTPRCNGNSCPGSKYITSSTSCNTHYCKVNGGWSSWKPWGRWGSCSTVCKPCGSSTDPTKTRRRYRACNNPTPACNGHSCSGRSYISASKSCNTHYCKVNGGWGSWESWTKMTNCSAECKKEGSVSPTQTLTRKRLCNNPSPSCNGQSCSGSASDKSVQNCNTQNCPVDGYWEWGNWGAWDECSKTCDSGSHKRIRYNKCIGPKYGGKSCSGKVTKTHTYHRGCNRNIPCPVDGGWASFKSWSEWTQCSRSCGGGLRERTRYRHCTNPRPLHGGKKCTGLDNDNVFEDCNTLDCPSFCTCFGYGDPHYYTPDGAEIHFMGICKYTLWKSTLPNDACSFRVETKNERRYGQTHVAYTRMIDFFIEQNKIRILQGGTTLLNGIAVGLPTTTANNSIEITRSGSYITAIHSKCNIRVQFDGSHMIDVKVSKNHFGGNLTGLCGNCNGNVKDDYQTKSGTDVSGLGWAGYASIGNSYKVLDDSDQPDLNCADAEAPGECSDKDKELAKTDDYCGYLLSDSSPFKICRDSKKVDFTKMYSSCEFDVCSSDKTDANCQTLESTALACSQHGYRVKWRTLKFCPLTCKGDFVYKTTVSCTNTCDNPKATQNCQDPPVDGCTCSDKTYLNGGKCVTIDKCGSCNLKIGGISSKLALGDVYPKGDCILSQRCDLVNGTFQLVTIPAKTSCALDEWCKTNNYGIYECTKKPINGGWQITGNWSNWSTCSKTCNGGIRKRARGRSCTNPKPQYGGASCAGSIKEISYESCNTLMCPSFCSCEGSGDPHYYTPDGAVIHFMGTCKYTLWKSTIPNDQCEFKVETKNERRYGYTHVSYTRMIDFYMGNTQIRFLHGGNVLIDGYRASLPVKTANDSIELSRSGSFISAVHAKCNIRVQFDGYHLVNVKVSKDYFAGNLTGICGNCNGNYRDDLQTKDGIDVSSKGGQGYADIGNSYKVTDDSDLPDKNCADVPPLKDCTEDKRKLAKTDKYCGFLATDTSPFKACMDSKKVNFVQLYSSCEVDFCNSNRTYVHCQTLQTAALACSQHGFQTKWRTPTFCPLKCDGGLVYKSAISCTNTCDNPTADQNCQDPPVDGCTCPDNTFLNGDKCVTIDRCGSCRLDIGRGTSKLALGDVYPKGDCIKAQKCISKNGTFNMVSVPASIACASDEWCKLNKLGVYTCTKKPVDGGWKIVSTFTEWSVCSKTCNGGTRQRTRIRSCTEPMPQYGGKSCVGSTIETETESCNTFKCPSFCSCEGSGDPHYYTPDGAAIHFMGTCKYTLWKSTIPDDNCEFKVETKNERRGGNTQVSYTRRIDFYFGNSTIRILQGGHTLVNGLRVSLPVKTENGNIEISRSGSFISAVHAKCNIRVQFDGYHLVNVKVSKNYFGGNLTGICGNCNGNYMDDLQTKNGTDVSSKGRLGHADIGKSYKVTDDSDLQGASCEDDSIYKDCPKDKQEMARKETYCGFLTSDTSPFKACIDSKKVNVDQFYSSCEVDFCNSNKFDVHCQTLQTTALACSQNGFQIKWRTSTFCPLKCNGDFVYKSAISCINTCDNPTAEQNCQDPPIDGCTCPSNTYLNGDKCVTIDKCGSCRLNTKTGNLNIAYGDVYPRGDCIDSQKCEKDNRIFKLVSVKSLKSCLEDEWCKPNKLGIYECAKKPALASETKTESVTQPQLPDLKVLTTVSLAPDTFVSTPVASPANTPYKTIKQGISVTTSSLPEDITNELVTSEIIPEKTTIANPFPSDNGYTDHYSGPTSTEHSGNFVQSTLEPEKNTEETKLNNFETTSEKLTPDEMTTVRVVPEDDRLTLAPNRSNTDMPESQSVLETTTLPSDMLKDSTAISDKTTESNPYDVILTTPRASTQGGEVLLETSSSTKTRGGSYITTPISYERSTEKGDNLEIDPTSTENNVPASTNAMDTGLFITTPNALDVEQVTVFETEPDTTKTSNINESQYFTGDSTSQSTNVPTQPSLISDETLTDATTTNDTSPVYKESPRGHTTETQKGEMTSETQTVPTQTSVITDEILAEATTAQDNGPINKESSTGNTEGVTTNQSNYVPTESSLITDEIPKEATTANDRSRVKIDSSLGNTTESPDATTSFFNPTPEEQNLETTTTEGQTTQQALPIEDSEDKTSESNIVPTQASLITTEMLALKTTEMLAGDSTENAGDTTTYTLPITEEIQVETTTTNDKTTPLHESSTPQSITIPKESDYSDGATEMIDSTQPATTAWEQTEDQYTTVEMKDKTTNVGSKSANKTAPGPTDILPTKAKIEGVTKAYSEFKCKTKWGYYPDPNNCAGFIQCDWGKPKRRPCAKGTIWNQTYRTCVHGSC
ncbi:uncharacterized protein LOC143074038 [Mytilus galloprovincialis]|uniref:uncharacterized protein LOC143074038 n=1 Tax=Mytilus galloprovincialis TaxID=29158 RepID=UPI003F7B645C